jgi:hypothetical protein
MTDSLEKAPTEGIKSDALKSDQFNQKLLEIILQPINNANQQIERVMSVYKWLAAIIGGILITAMTLFYIVFGNNVESLTKQVQARIDLELQQPNIQKIIRTEVLAKLNSDEVSSIVRQGTFEMQQFYRIFNLYNDLDEHIDSYDELNDIASSQNYSFRDIQKLAGDMLKNFHSKIANHEFIKYIDKRGKYMFLAYSEELGSDPNKWTIDNFKSEYFSIDADLRPSCSAYLWFGESKISLSDKLDFLQSVLETDKNSWAIYTAAMLINREASINKNFLSERAEYIKWWKEHKTKYLNKQERTGSGQVKQ